MSETSASVQRIRAAVSETEAHLRQRHPLLRYQDAIGAGIMLLALAGMAASGMAWHQGLLPAWLSIPLAAWFASLIHELEHDLIHYLYFRKRPIPHHLMLALGWLSRPLTINPWIRRRLHFHHHKHSGTESDIEERAITNGEHWGLKRLVMLFDGMAAVFLRALNQPNARRRWRVIWRGLAAYFPLGIAAWATWYLFLAGHLLAAVSSQPENSALAGAMPVIDILVVTLLAPNLLRSFCLNLVSSNMHYYGDVEDGNLVQQTQVLNPWWLAPLQVFCCNFGGTHAIHHFVVGQPFYLRQLIAKAVYPVLRDEGVRFNDWGTFGRANRWGALTRELKVES